MEFQELGSHGNHAAMSENMPAVKRAIEDALAILRVQGIRKRSSYYRFAATQVDWIGHSMGGVLPRYYHRWMESAEAWRRATNFGTGDIHKLVVLNSPQSGSPLASGLHFTWRTEGARRRKDRARAHNGTHFERSRPARG